MDLILSREAQAQTPYTTLTPDTKLPLTLAQTHPHWSKIKLRKFLKNLISIHSQCTIVLHMHLMMCCHFN